MRDLILNSDQNLARAPGVSRATVWRITRRGDLTNLIRLGTAARWRRDEVETARDRLTAAQRGGMA